MLIDICIKFREYSLSGFQVIVRTRFVTDRQTDGQTDGRPGKNNMSPDPKGGRNNYPPCKQLNGIHRGSNITGILHLNWNTVFRF